MTGTSTPSNDKTTPLLEATEDDDRYLLHSRSEVIHSLRELITKGALVTAYFNHGREFILTALLTVLPDRVAFVFDCGSNNELNEKLAASDRIIFVAALQGVKIQFSTGKPREVQYKGKDAFIADLPEQLMRLQRREFYRLELPGFARIECTIPNPEGEKETTLNIHDISLGGLSLVANKQFENCEIMQKFHNCHVDLRDGGSITVSLEVRNLIPIYQKNGSSTTRIGCRFIGITPAMEILVQRFMVKVEKEIRG